MAGSSGYRNGTPKKVKKTKIDTKTNRSILTFFKKAEVEESLFLEGPASQSIRGSTHYDGENNDDDESTVHPNSVLVESRLDESEQSNKRRKLNVTEGMREERNTNDGSKEASPLDKPHSPKIPKTVSGFVIEDSEDDDEGGTDVPMDSDIKIEGNITPPVAIKVGREDREPRSGLEEALFSNLEKRAESNSKICDEKYGDFLDDGEWPDDEDLHGPENRETRCSQEQAKLEEGGYGGNNPAEDLPSAPESGERTCPICNGDLADATPNEATRHVNGCLDGNPTHPLPESKPKPFETAPPKTPTALLPEPRVKAAASTVSAQVAPNKIRLSTTTNIPGASGSAFSKLMATSVEEAAWSGAAAAADASARGRGTTRKRTCPFYKIMPGFFITVDAFCYGAVEGCNAYFLSHFHSDHYMGLGASWNHGPIYCSKATANLVKQQLKTDEKWLVPLEFEKRYDIPNTGGATVVMIDANHCPGSCLFLFEKPISRLAKKQRILHCGDFRAAKEHITHPLLRPETTDPVTGKTVRQTIDACYLDTTYLNPKYSFPPQRDVIASCAELCATMQAEPDNKRPWEKSGGGGWSSMSRFVSFAKCKPKDPDPPKNATNPFTVASGTAKPLSLPTAAASKHNAPVGKYPPNRVLVVCGTYSIGKEKIVIAIAEALGSKIFAPTAKRRICKALADPKVDQLLTSDPLEAQVHMQSLMDVKGDALKEYLDGFKPHFARAVAFRPSGWNFSQSQNVGGKGRKQKDNGGGGGNAGKAVVVAPGNNKGMNPANLPTTAMLHHHSWRSRFSIESMTPARGWTEDTMVFGVPYSEHSSFRDLALFVMGLDILKVVPTVNVGNADTRKRMRAWVDRWTAERRRGGFVSPLNDDGDGEGQGDGGDASPLWDGSKGARGVYW
ncbi:DNA repair metallo-beta-lactamase [Zalerion maritima]|uniref:DNA repair metallo-beta-lactamase n=1 Tax=Zalerion maritima TaxID=339359 RepID=A0AAD5WQP8_9PEZI|nr:DNA repair metallo-beta-lactamase [Zalerion maritima]